MLSICIAGCQAKPKPFPSVDIVYERSDENQPAIGFINADGTDAEMWSTPSELLQPFWLQDRIYGLDWRSATTGRFMGQLFSWDDGSNLKVCPGTEWELLTHVGASAITTTVVVNDRYAAIVQADPLRCKFLKTLVSVPDTTRRLLGGELSPDGKKLAYSLVSNMNMSEAEYDYAVMILDLDTGTVVRLDQGINPTWSPDGKQLAYVKPDGLALTSLVGDRRRKLVDAIWGDTYTTFAELGPVPRWSPDGKSLVYHRCVRPQCGLTSSYDIYKLDLASGQQTLLTTGGMFPFWRMP